ncbi:MAG: hypothetical protein ABW199_11270, partial [Caulobacterales bacterium]
MTQEAAKVSRIQSFFAALTGWRVPALSFAAGAVAALGYAPLFLFPAYVLGIVVLIWLLDAAAQSPRRARAFFGRAWFWGLGHCLVGMYWIASPFMVDPQSWGLLWAIPSTLLFAGGLGVFWGLGGLL